MEFENEKNDHSYLHNSFLKLQELIILCKMYIGASQRFT